MESHNILFSRRDSDVGATTVNGKLVGDLLGTSPLRTVAPTSQIIDTISNISEEKLEQHIVHLFDTISNDYRKRLESKLDVVQKKYIEDLKQNLKEAYLNYKDPNYKDIVKNIQCYHYKQFQEEIKTTEDEERIAFQKNIADTQEGLRTLFRYSFFMKERQKFATLPPFKNRCN